MVSCDVGVVRVMLQELDFAQACRMGDVRSSMGYSVFALLFQDDIILVNQVLIYVFQYAL